MRGIFIVFVLMSFGTVTMAQSTKILTAWNSMKKDYTDLEKAKEAIDAAAIHPKTKKKVRTWYFRGKCYYMLYKSADVKLKSLDPNPLKEAYLSYAKANDLDKNDKYTDIDFKLGLICTEMYNKGSAEYKQKKYKESLESFETVLEISKLPCINQLDTAAVFHAAIAADQAGLYDKALHYYFRTIDLKYKGSDVYHYIAKIYMAKGDTAQAIQSYEDGIITDEVQDIYIL